MDAMLALLSGLFIFIGSLLIVDAMNRRAYGELAYYIILTVISGVICFISFIDLPNPSLPSKHWNAWKAGLHIGALLIIAIGICVISTAGRRGN